MTKYDTIAGDGDCGTTLLSGVNGSFFSSRRMFTVFLTGETALVWYSTNLGVEDPVDMSVVLRQVVSLVEESMGGTSGAIYAIFLNAVSTALDEDEEPNKGLQAALVHALQEGLSKLCKYTSARVGGRTMMDALIPFVEALSQQQQQRAQDVL